MNGKILAPLLACLPIIALADEGFMAASRNEELVCPGQQISVLVDLANVTNTISKATADLADTEANYARKAKMTKLEAECEEDSGGKLKCEAVSLYNGGQYYIYKYKRYDDVRLVFAPQLDIAAFGGDPDNFNFPRWCLDMSFLRVYENGEPASTPNYLQWRKSSPAADDPVFIAGGYWFDESNTEPSASTPRSSLKRWIKFMTPGTS